MKRLKLLLALFSLITFWTACEEFELEQQTDTLFHVQIEGTELPVWVRGNSNSQKFIVFINGGPGLTSLDIAKADMFGWSSGLEKDFAMVYYDQRGCGNAQGNIDLNTLTIEQYVDDLDAIVDVLKAKYEQAEVYLMGHSFGGFIGANYLLSGNLQDKIAGWISVDGAYNFDYDLSWQYRRTFLINIANEEIDKDQNSDHWNSALEWATVNSIIESREQKNEWRSFIGAPGQRIIPEELAELSVKHYLKIGFSSSYNPVPAYLSKNLQIVNDRLNGDAEGVNLIASVSGITLPTLMIWGRYDDLIVPEEGQDVFNNIGTADTDKHFSLIANSSHEPYISSPVEFQEAITQFVNTY